MDVFETIWNGHRRVTVGTIIVAMVVFVSWFTGLPPEIQPAFKSDILKLERVDALDEANWANFHLMNLQSRLARLEAELDQNPGNRFLIDDVAELKRQVREQVKLYDDASERAQGG